MNNQSALKSSIQMIDGTCNADGDADDLRQMVVCGQCRCNR